MNKKKAIEILTVHACCTTVCIGNYMCMMCPWNETEDCKDTFVTEQMLIDAVKTLRGDNVRLMKLEDIKISENFANSTPSEEKMNECRRNWNTFKRQDRYIVVDHNNVLIDGYIMFLILKEHKEEDAEVKISHRRKKRWERKDVEGWKTPRYRNNPTTYVFGTHPNSKGKTVYTWRVPESWGNWAENIQIGDTVLCITKNGYAPVVVNKIEILDKCPVEFRVKKVVKREIRRNGMVVEL